MKQLRHFLLLIILTLVAFACSKDDPKPTTKADLLASKKWQLQSLTIDNPLILDTVNGQPFAPTDWYNNLLGACERDDIVTFRIDGNKVYTMEDTGTPCGTGIIWQTGSWVLSADETEISLSNGSVVSYYLALIYGVSLSENWKIVTLDNSTLKVTFSIGNTSSTRTFTYTFIAV